MIFSAKVLFRRSVCGEPYKIDEDYIGSVDLLEERIVSLEALDLDDAIREAEREAEKYAQSESGERNPYGQFIWTSYLGAINVFEPSEELPVEVELFSMSYFVDKNVSDYEVVNGHFGSLQEGNRWCRKKFVAGEIIGFVE